MINRSRFAQLLPLEEARTTPMHVVGVGALGSKVALSCVKMGFQEVYAYDPDRIEEGNIATQSFFNFQVGETKVGAMVQLASLIGGAISGHNGPYGAVMGTRGVTFLLTDSLESRRNCLDAYLRHRREVGDDGSLLVDARMALETLEIYLPQTIEEVEEHLKVTLEGQDDAVDLPCGITSVPYTGDALVGIVMPLVRRWCVGFKVPHTVLADLSQISRTKEFWREGEGWEEEKIEDVQMRPTAGL